MLCQCIQFPMFEGTYRLSFKVVEFLRRMPNRTTTDCPLHDWQQNSWANRMWWIIGSLCLVGTYCLHLQGSVFLRRMSGRTGIGLLLNQPAPKDSHPTYIYFPVLVLCGTVFRILDPWMWKDWISIKRGELIVHSCFHHIAEEWNPPECHSENLKTCRCSVILRSEWVFFFLF